MVKLRLAAADCVVAFAVAKYLLAENPGADRPAGQRDAVPGRPAALGLLLGIADRRRLLRIDQYKVRIIADFDPPFADDVPHAGGRVAHPTGDLLDRAAAAVYLIEHQGQ